MARRYKKKQPPKYSQLWGQWLKNLFLNARVAAFTLVIAFLALNHLGTINWMLDFLGRGFIAEANSAYLHKSKLSVGDSILVLTGLDTSLEVLKSSSAGFSFFVKIDVQIGNIVATLQELANKALMISLAAAGSLVVIELALEAAEILAVPILSVTIVALTIHYGARKHWNWAAAISGQISQILILTTLLTHIGLPIVIYASSLASASLTAPLAQQAHSRFTDTHVDFATIKQEYKEDKKRNEEKQEKNEGDSAKYEEISPHLRAVVDKYKATSNTTTHKKTRSFSGAVVRHGVAVLFDSYIFPALLLIIFVWASKVVVSHSLKIEELVEDTTPDASGMQDGKSRPRRQR